MGSDLATMVIWCCLGWFRFGCVQLAVKTVYKVLYSQDNVNRPHLSQPYDL